MNSSVTHRSLNGAWELRPGALTSEARLAVPAVRPLDARVPGDVTLDLMRAGRIRKDPQVGDGVRALRRIGERAWWFRRRFDADPAGAPRHELVFDGLCYLADCWLNGVYLGRHANMHRPFAADVTACLRAHNVLDVRLLAFLPGVEALPAMDWGAHYNAAVANGYAMNRGWMRKAAYSFGWDWAQAVPLCGLWRDVRLVSAPRAVLDDVCVRARADGRLAVSWTGRGAGSGTARAEVSIAEDAGNRPVLELVRSCPLRPGALAGAVSGRVARPALWWPAGMGAQPLYRATVTLRDGPDLLDRREVLFGFRDVRIAEPRLGPDRGAFRFVINGEPVYARGANWVPPDIIPARVPDARYARLTDLALEAGLNYLRFWGGGIYERPVFYELCDRKGLMLWHDLMFGNREHPDFDPAFTAECRREIEWAVTALRNHPSIVLWCGSNETDQVCRSRKAIRPGGRYFGERLLHEDFPAWIKPLDPTREYRPSSGCVGRHSPPDDPPTNPRHGVSHTVYPDPFGPDEPLDATTASFVNEWYAGSPPLEGSLRKFLKPAERAFGHPTLELHNFLPNLVARGFLKQMAEYFIPTDPAALPFAALCEWYRVWHAETMIRCIEHYRRSKWRCGGNAFWMFNAAYTALDWSLVDYYLAPKPAFYAARRANRPVVPVIGRYRDRLEVHLVNDTRQAWRGTLELALRAFDGAARHRERHAVCVQANGSRRVWVAPFSRLPAFDPKACFAQVVLKPADGGPPIVNHRFLAPYKQLKLPTASVRVRPVAGRPGAFRLSSGVLARWVSLLPCDANRRPNDNFFDLLPGLERIITFPAPVKPRDLRVAWRNRPGTADLVLSGVEPDLDAMTPGAPERLVLEFYNAAPRPARIRLATEMSPAFALEGPRRAAIAPGATERMALRLHADPLALPVGRHPVRLRAGRLVWQSSIRVRPAFQVRPDGELRFENKSGAELPGGTLALRYLAGAGQPAERRLRVASFPPGPFRARFEVSPDAAPDSGELWVGKRPYRACWLGAADAAALWRRLPRRPFRARRLAVFRTTHERIPDLLREGHGWLIAPACRDSALTRLGAPQTPMLLFLHAARRCLILTVCRPGAPVRPQDGRVEVALARGSDRREFEAEVVPDPAAPRVVGRVRQGRPVSGLDERPDLDVLAPPGLLLIRYRVPWASLGLRAPAPLRLALALWDGPSSCVRVFDGIHGKKDPSRYGQVTVGEP